MIAEKTRIKLNVITFMVLAVALIYAMATQVLSILEDRYSVYAIFPDAGGVFTNQEVTYRGITVGQVGGMEIVEKGVKIELEIFKEYQVPKENTEARVMFKSAVGEQFVDLLPGSDEGPYFENGDKIPLSQTSIPVSTQELLSTLEAVLRGVPPEDLKGAVDALGIGLTGTGPDLATILESVADLSTLFAERAPEVQSLLRHGTEVGGAFLDSREEFITAIRRLVSVSDSLAGSTGDLERLMKGGNLTADEVIRLLRENKEAVNRFIVEFAEVNALQAEHAGDLSKLFVHLPSALDRVNRTFEPDTGMVRFGLVDDLNNSACSYGTPRRNPSNRTPNLPAKGARCQGAGGSGSTSNSFSSFGSGPAASRSNDVSTSSLLGGADFDAGPSLPARMSDWSWVLVYLNSFE
jgi:phospholipid/cholesterol/gamma-HCH transport system substrate-binding protein